MNQKIPRVVDELHQAANSYVPPPAPIDQLLVGGRRRRRRKQAFSIMASVTAVAAVAAGVALGAVALPRPAEITHPATVTRVSTYDHIRFLRPPGWRVVPVTFISGAGAPAAYWTNQRTGPECRALPNGGRCGPPVKALHRNGALVIVGSGLPEAAAPFHTNTTVAGRPASIRAADCSRTAPPSSIGRSCYRGASRVLIAEVVEPGVHPSPGSIAIFRLEAYFGPGSTRRLEQQMRHVLATAQPTLTPSQRQAALDAAHVAADQQAAGVVLPRPSIWPRSITEVTASVHDGPIQDSNLQHSCNRSAAVDVTLFGKFNTTVAPHPASAGQEPPPTVVRALHLVVDTHTGHTCDITVQSGHVSADPAAVVLFKR